VPPFFDGTPASNTTPSPALFADWLQRSSLRDRFRDSNPHKRPKKGNARVLAFLLLGAVVGLLLGVAIRSQYLAMRVDQRSWEELVAALEPVDFGQISSVALDYLDPREGQITLEPRDLWLRLGGKEGLRRMRQNARLMLLLAAHAQRWNFDEGVIVTERMRREALYLQRAVRRVEMALRFHTVLRHSATLIPFHLHEAASAYYLMRQRLLALYQTSHSGLYPRLAEVL
jgi:hypothetical protein